MAEPWLVLSLSGSSFYVGLDSFALNAPVWALTLFGGLLADRADRRKLILFFQALQFLGVTVLFFLLITGHLSIWFLIFVSFLTGATDSISMPAFQAIVPSLVDKQQIPGAISLNSAQFNLSRVLGPAIAGMVLAKFGPNICFGANVLSYIPFFLFFVFIPIKKHRSDVSFSPPSGWLREIPSVLKNKYLHRPLLNVTSNSLFASPLMIFASVIVKEYFQGSAAQFGFSMGAFGVGGFFGAIFSFYLPTLSQDAKNASLLGLFLGFVILVAAFVHNYFLLVTLFFLAGFFLTASNTLANSFIQSKAEDDSRGRVISFFQLSLRGGMAIAALVSGTVIGWIGLRETLFFNGILAIGLQVFLLSVDGGWTKKSRALPTC